MSIDLVREFFTKAGRLLTQGGVLIIYGPFRYQGEYTSESNRGFDSWLKRRDPESGIRDMDYLKEIAADNRLILRQDICMPANNQLLVWEKSE